MSKSLHFRQGDVLLVRIDKIPLTAKKAKDCVLALGEVTGHKHQVKSGARQFIDRMNAAIAGQEQIQRFLRVTAAKCLLVHEEHSSIEIPKGDYQVIIQKEYSPSALRDVMD